MVAGPVAAAHGRHNCRADVTGWRSTGGYPLGEGNQIVFPLSWLRMHGRARLIPSQDVELMVSATAGAAHTKF
jgi:hypothetical protein